MAKTRTPFFGLGSQGSVGESITTQRRGKDTVIRRLPLPTDPYSLPQAYQRWLYKDYAHLWTTQSSATKQLYATAGSRHHLTGFQEWMRVMLSTLPDIVGMWRLDEISGAVAQDSSPYGYHGTIIGASPITGRIAGAYHFDGINDRISLGVHAPWYHGTGDFSFSFFIRYTTAASWAIFSSYDGTNIPASVRLNTRIGGTLSLHVFGHGGWGTNVFSDNPLNDGLLHSIVARRQSQVLHMFVDGQIQVDVDASIIDLDNTQKDYYFGWDSTGYLPGDLDHFIYYNRALDTQDALNHSERRYPL